MSRKEKEESTEFSHINNKRAHIREEDNERCGQCKHSRYPTTGRILTILLNRQSIKKGK